jgi:hypothetical protein
MPTADNSQTAKIRHLANKNITAYKLLNPTSQFSDQSTFIRNVEGRLRYVSQTGTSRTVDESINNLNNEILGISSATPTPPPDWIKYTGTAFNDYTSMRSLAYGSGTWFAIVYDRVDPAAQFILTSSNPASSWALNALTNATPANLMFINAAYGDGLWCILYSIHSTTDTIGVNISSNGGVNWTTHTVSENGVTIKKIYYANSTWVIIGDSNQIYVATDPSGTWDSVIPNSTDEENASAYSDIYYGDGTWCLIGKNGMASILLTASDPADSWVLSSVDFNVVGEGFSLETTQNIHYGDGTWVQTVGYDIFTTTDPVGEWDRNTQSLFLSALSYGNSLWVSPSGANEIYKTTVPSGTWVKDTSTVLIPAGENDFLYLVAYGNNTFVAAGLYMLPNTQDERIQLFTYVT